MWSQQMNMRKPQQNAAKSGKLPLRKAGTKQAPSDLAEFIRLANLVPQGYWLPPELVPNLDGLSPEKGPAGTTWGELSDRLHQLPESVRKELFDRSKIEPATAEEREIVAYDYFPESYRISQVLQHYEKIRVAYYNLRGLTQDSIDPLNQLLQALGHADLSYLRRCPKADCGKIFYAGKHTQLGCSTEHSSAIRQQRKRDRDKLNRQNAKKRATPAPKR